MKIDFHSARHFNALIYFDFLFLFLLLDGKCIYKNMFDIAGYFHRNTIYIHASVYMYYIPVYNAILYACVNPIESNVYTFFQRQPNFPRKFPIFIEKACCKNNLNILLWKIVLLGFHRKVEIFQKHHYNANRTIRNGNWILLFWRNFN